MMISSFLIMYVIMFLNVAAIDHIYNSLTRTYRTLLMIALMAILMMAFMWKTYPNTKVNFGVITVSIILFISTLTLLRTQEPVGDKQWMKAMIPHHSSAILTSNKANLKDPEVKKLALEIIEAQKKEIAEMKSHLDRLNKTR